MAVTARWERPDGRRQLSVTAPLFVGFAGDIVRATEWSLSGFTVAEGETRWPDSRDVDAKVTLPFQGFEVSFSAPVQVVARDPERGTVSLDYVSLGSRERELLCHFLDELVRGSMVDVRDTIQRIDVPVAPVLVAVQDAPTFVATGLPKAGTALFGNRGFMSGLYAALGVFVFGYLGTLVFANVFRFETENAVYSTPTEAIAAQGEGMVSWAEFRPGDAVKAGDTLANVVDNQLERDIELADITVREREAKVGLLQQRSDSESARLQSPAGGQSSSVTRLRLDIESLQARVQASEQEIRRVSLRPRDAQTPARTEEARKKLLAHQKALESRQGELKARIEREQPGARGTATAIAALPYEITPIDAQLAQALQDYDFAKLRHQAVIAHRVRLAIRAPFDGVLTALPRIDRGGVRKGETMAIVEQRAAPFATAFLNARDVNRIGVGDPVRLYVPTLREYLPARIALIDRAAGGRRDVERPGVDGRVVHGPVDGGAKVVLHLDQPELVKHRPGYQNGLPVVVQFRRRWTMPVVTAAVSVADVTVAETQPRP
jgi:multidrug resistance efflux pump